MSADGTALKRHGLSLLGLRSLMSSTLLRHFRKESGINHLFNLCNLLSVLSQSEESSILVRPLEISERRVSFRSSVDAGLALSYIVNDVVDVQLIESKPQHHRLIPWTKTKELLPPSWKEL
jgi:hypothetical protein